MHEIINRSVHLDARYEEIGESHIEVESFVQQVARYKEIVNYALGLNHSCNKLHATRERI